MGLAHYTMGCGYVLSSNLHIVAGRIKDHSIQTITSSQLTGVWPVKLRSPIGVAALSQQGSFRRHIHLLRERYSIFLKETKGGLHRAICNLVLVTFICKCANSMHNIYTIPSLF